MGENIFRSYITNYEKTSETTIKKLYFSISVISEKHITKKLRANRYSNLETKYELIL